MTKMLWFCKQDIPYYVLQEGELREDWIADFELQIKEILLLSDPKTNKGDKFMSNQLSETRVKSFIFSRMKKLVETLDLESWNDFIIIEPEKIFPSIFYTPKRVSEETRQRMKESDFVSDLTCLSDKANERFFKILPHYEDFL